MMNVADQVIWLRKSGRTPHQLCKTVAGVLWECISMPYAEGSRVDVMIRVPGDPTTIRSVEAVLVHSEGQACLCAEGGEFYFRDSAWMAERRAREVDAWETAGISRRRAWRA